MRTNAQARPQRIGTRLVPAARSVAEPENHIPRYTAVPRGVSDGTRTRDRRDHNPELYQLSYAHQAPREV